MVLISPNNCVNSNSPRFSFVLAHWLCETLDIERHVLILLLSILMVVASGYVHAEIIVQVSEDYRAIQYQGDTEIPPGKSVALFELQRNDFKDKYHLKVTASQPGVDLNIIDGRDVDKDNLNPLPIVRAYVTTPQSIEIGTPPTSAGLVGIAINRSRVPVQASSLVIKRGKRPLEVRNKMRDFVAIPFKALAEVYNLPSLTVTVKPCGSVNAYSTPDIFVCTELLADLFGKGVPDAIHAILFHEIAHSLLFSWDIPGYDNEDMADEFAAVLLAKESPETLNDYIRWLEKRDSISEAVLLLSGYSDRHSLSIQRARNMQTVLDNPDSAIRRWNKLLLEHVRK